ncbi:MAG: amidohydrolase [Nitrospirota bacterium]|nr:MAG: amidohydrolase [Nitrospirota bacterium]
MKKADIIIKAENILTMSGNDDGHIVNGAVAIVGNKIGGVGKAEAILSEYSSDAVIDHGKSIIMPGLINTHTHAAMVYFRGMADDLPLKTWLEEHIWPAEGKWLGNDFVRDATELACLEMLQAGVTTFLDMYFFGDASAESVKKIGMRAVLGVGILDFPSVAAQNTDEYFEKAEVFIKRYEDDNIITPCIAPHAPYTCGPDTYRRAVDISEKYGIPIHTHLSETEWEVNEIISRYKMRPAEYIDSAGALNRRMIAAHCVWLDDKEIDLFAERGASVSHCPESNMKLASGSARVAKMIERGVNVTLGTDGAASNNDLDVLGEMQTASKLHKLLSGDPTVIDARRSVMMATAHAADALGMQDSLGRIKAGFRADLIVVDINKPHMTPMYDVYSHLVYSAKASDIQYVMVDGIPVIDNGQPVLVSGEEVIARANEWAERIRE